jgi:nitroreductase
MLKDLILKNRSYRRFRQDTPVTLETLRELVELARFSASVSNRQPLKYILCCDPEVNARIFLHLAWAGFLADWGGPAQDERPTAYIIILNDKTIAKVPGVDHGIAAQSIMLGASERGLGGCMVGSIEKGGLRKVLGIPDQYEILLVLALGKPAEKVVIEDVGADGSYRYYRDKNDVHHVPKRTLDELIWAEFAD